MEELNTNPVDLGLTNVQANVYQIIVERYKSGQLTTRADIQRALGVKSKSWICSVLRALRDKGLVVGYEQRLTKRD